MDLYSKFENSIKNHPHKIAFTFFDEGEKVDWTYQEFQTKVIALAAALKKLGLKKGDRVGLIAANSPYWTMVDLSCAYLGCILVPIHLTISGDQMGRILNEARVKFLFLGSHEALQSFLTLQELLPDVQKLIRQQFQRYPFLKKLILIEDAQDKITHRKMTHYLNELLDWGLDHHPKNFRRPKIKPTDLATTLYTSGTTGQMKGVQLTHQNIMENAIAAAPPTHMAPNETYLVTLPLSHALERTCVYAGLFQQAHLAYNRSLNLFLDDLKEFRPTMFTAVPRLLEKLCVGIRNQIERIFPPLVKVFETGVTHSYQFQKLKKEGNYLYSLYWLQTILANKIFYQNIRNQLGGRLRRIICGGARLDPAIAMFFEGIGIPILEGYGLTEAGPIVSVNPNKNRKIGSVGKPLKKVKVKISPDGEVLVKGPNVMKGYRGMPKETEKAIDKEGWLHTGDLGRLDKDGYLYITGRSKELIVTNYGKNIVPSIVEKELEKSPFIKQIMVYGEGKPYLTALLVPERPHVEKYFSRKNIISMSWNRLCHNPELIKKLKKEIQFYNRNLSNHEKVKKFQVIPQEFTEHNNLLTPTLKLRRPAIVKKYHRQIEKLYR